MKKNNLPYSYSELMIASAASEIKDHDVVFVGMRLPLLAFLVAKSTHAPNAYGLFENGIIRNDLAPGPMITMADPPNQCGAIKLCPLNLVMSFLSRGKVDLGFIGGAQVDQYGNVNTHQVTSNGKTVRLPGSGGAADIACLAKKLLIVMPHEKRRFVSNVEFITSPGHGKSQTFRKDQGILTQGPVALITDLCVFRFPHGKAVLESLHPGVSLKYVKKSTFFSFESLPNPPKTLPPTAQQIEIIRFFDPNRFWTG